MSQLLSDIRAGGGIITAVNGGNNITVTTVAGVATVNVSGTTNHAVQVGNALGALTSLALGNAGQVLTSNGPGLDPSFQNFPGSLVKTITGNTGGPESPLLGNFNFLTANTTVKFAGSAATETLDFNLSNLVLGSDLASLTTGVRNVGLGAASLFATTSGNDNTAIGFGALNTLVGANNSNTAVGSLALAAATAGSNNTAIGDDALTLLATGSNNTALGRNAGSSYNAAEANTIIIGSGVTGIAGESNVIRIGQSNTSGIQLTTANNRLLHNFGTQNIFLGDTAGNFTLTTANAIGNTAVGFQSLQALTLGAGNTCIGQSAGTSITTGTHHTAIGLDALDSLLGGTDCVVVGDSSGTAYNTTESNNIILGANITGSVGEDNKMRLGNASTNQTYITGIFGNAPAGAQMAIVNASGQMGSQAIPSSGITTITGNDAVAESPSGGNFNFLTANSTIKFAGSAATETLDFSNTNLILGSPTVAINPIGGAVHNVGVGQSTLNNITTGSGLVAVGWSALAGVTTAGQTVAIGNQAMSNAVFTGGDCVAVGNNALRNASTALGDVGVGLNALFLLSSGAQNVAIGSSSLGQLTTGSNNICIGNGIGFGNNYTSSESSNILMANQGIVSESNVIRIGTSGSGAGQQNKCFIAGIDGVNVGSVARVVTEASDQLGTATITAGTGVSIVPTANVITVNAVGGGLTWTVETVNLTAAVNHGYIANKAGTLAIALPAVSAIGDVIRITGMNTATGIQITQAAGQQIFFGTGSTTLGATGTLTSTAIRDSLELVCIAPNLTWNVISAIGNWTIV